MTDFLGQVRFWGRRLAIPVGSAALIGLVTIGVFLDLFHRIPRPKFPAPVYNLQAAALGNQTYLFLSRRDASGGPSKQTRWMSPVDEGRIQGESEVKPFNSFVSFSDKLWFFDTGMYRMFDGKDWSRFDAPWIGEDPVVTATAEQMWVFSRFGKDYSLIPYTHNVWERPVLITTDPVDQTLFCSERCPSRLVVFKDTVIYFWLKDRTLYRWMLDREHPGRVEPLGEVFGPLDGFDALSDSKNIFLWYISSLPPTANHEIAPIGLKDFDGTEWREEASIKRSAPVGLLEISAYRAQDKIHLLINTGIRIEDTIWEGGPPGRSVFWLGGDLARTVLRYQERVLWLLLGMGGVATVGLTFALVAWNPKTGNSSVPYASLARRFLAKAIDTGLIMIPAGILIRSTLNPETLLSQNSMAGFFEETGMGLLLAVFLLLVYHALAEGIWGQTVGKRLCGIRVVDREQKPCTMVQSLIRNFLRFVDGIGFYWVGLISIAATDRRQRLGDLAGRTIVVRTKT